MDRRTFLKIGTLGTAGLAVPPWIARAFFRGAEAPPGRSRHLAEALARAAAIGKPLLVLVVPADPVESHRRGRLFGGLLNTAGEETLAELSLCEVVCATAAQIRPVVGEERLSGEPLMALLEGIGTSLSLSPIHPELPPEVFDRGEQTARERIDRTAKAIHAVVAPDPETIARRAQAAAATLSAEEISGLSAIAEGTADPVAAIADRGAAVLLRLANEDPSRRPRVVRVLADAAIERLRTQPPAGAKWARTEGCADWLEDGSQETMYWCGMGFVPPVSRRFLKFFVED